MAKLENNLLIRRFVVVVEGIQHLGRRTLFGFGARFWCRDVGAAWRTA
jgi:hypothetical protein